MMVETELSSESADDKIGGGLGGTVSLNTQISWQRCFEMTSQSDLPLKIDPSLSPPHMDQETVTVANQLTRNLWGAQQILMATPKW